MVRKVDLDHLVVLRVFVYMYMYVCIYICMRYGRLRRCLIVDILGW